MELMVMLPRVLVVGVISLVATYAVRGIARRVGAVARPRKDRWHSQPTALFGGVAICLAFTAGVWLFQPQPAGLRRLLLASGFLFVVGLIDDLLQIKPYIKLAAQLVAASLLAFSGHILPWTGIELVDYLITFTWLVGITNAINMLDNMDGLAGGMSLIACLFLAVNFALNGQQTEVLLPLMLGAAIAGFLVYNFNPASIFMGDCGSMFIGFAIAGMALLSNMQRTRNLAAVLATPVLILLLPIFDTTIVTITRTLNGRSVSQGGRDHTSHRLVALGMSDRKAVLWLYFFSIVSGVLALMVRNLRVELGIGLIAGFSLTVVLLGLFLGKVRVYDEATAPAGALPDLITGRPYKRRLLEVSIDFTLIIVVYYFSYLLRFEGALPVVQLEIFLRSLPLIIAMTLFTFLASGIYRGLWIYAGIEDLVRIGQAAVFASAFSALITLYWYGFRGPSKSVFAINAVLLTMVTGASRISFRLLETLIVGRRRPGLGGKSVLIYGAGDSGEMLARELAKNFDHGYDALGFIDDDPNKIGKSLRGLTIYPVGQLPALVEKHGVATVLVSSRKIGEDQYDKFRGRGVEFRRLKIEFE